MYGYIRLPDSLAPLVDHPLYQRLRRIAQTSLTSTVYPSATGTRFEHSLGAMHLARQGWTAIVANSKRGVLDNFEASIHETVSLETVDAFDQIRDALGAAALLHDIGHPPFSHVLEPAFRRLSFSWFDLPAPRPDVLAPKQQLIDRYIARTKAPFHEGAGYVLVHQLLDDVAGSMAAPLPKLIRAIALARRWDGGWASALHSVIDAEIDVDRLDYLMRDGQRAGTEFGFIDWERLIDSLTLIEQQSRFRVLPKARARSAVETLLLQRSQAYKWLIFHPRVIGANRTLAEAVDDALEARGGVDTDLERPLPGMGAGPPWTELNYLDPRTEDLGLAAGTEADELQAKFGTALQAFADDGRLLELLKEHALDQARVLYTSGDTTSAADIQSARKSLALCRTVLLRRKGFLAAWKTYEEFRAVIRLLLNGEKDLASRIASVYERAAEEQNRSDERRRDLRTQGEEARERLSKSEVPVAAFNHYLKIAVSSATQRCLLVDRLAKQPMALPDGFWMAEYLRFDSIRETGTLAEVVDESGAVHRVRDTWSVVQGLAAADESRVGLLLYYFILDDPGLDSWSRAAIALKRDAMRGAFTTVFPDFLAEQLALAIDAEDRLTD